MGSHIKVVGIVEYTIDNNKRMKFTLRTRELYVPKPTNGMILIYSQGIKNVEVQKENF